MQNTVQIPAELFQSMRAIARKHRPYEACGLLLAEYAVNTISVRKIRLCENQAKNKIFYFRLSINDFRRAKSAWRTCKNRIVGVYHTHGIGSSEPSIHDRLAMRSKPGLYMIADTRGELKAFTSKFNRLQPVKISIQQ